MPEVIYTTPETANVDRNSTAPVIAITFLESGYNPIFTKASVDDLNGPGVTLEIQESAVVGSMFGWDIKGAAQAVEFFVNRQSKG